MCKTIRDIIPIGSKAIINGQEYLSDETMIAGISEKMCPYIRFLQENGNCEIYGLDIRTNKIFPLQEGQKQAFLECNELHQKRFSGDSVTKTVIHKSDCYVEGHKDISTLIATHASQERFPARQYIY